MACGPGVARGCSQPRAVILGPVGTLDSRHLVSINRFEKSPRTHAGNPTAADQEFLETWKPRLLEAVRKARADLEALE